MSEPAAFVKLRALPANIIAAASLLNDLNLSRRGLQRVHQYSDEARGVEYRAKNHPDAQRVRRAIRNACKRTTAEGKKVATYVVEQEHPGVPTQSVTFEVGNIDTSHPTIIYVRNQKLSIVDRHSYIMRRNVAGPFNSHRRKLDLASRTRTAIFRAEFREMVGNC